MRFTPKEARLKRAPTHSETFITTSDIVTLSRNRRTRRHGSDSNSYYGQQYINCALTNFESAAKVSSSFAKPDFPSGGGRGELPRAINRFGDRRGKIAVVTGGKRIGRER